SIMEIASLDSMQVELEIPEYDVGFIRPGQETRLRFPAVDGEVFETSLGDVYPASELREDQNVFVAPITIANETNRLRPGMRGEAITYGPVRPWIWSFMRRGWEKVVWWIGC
ncbi:MAG: efflux RND transporter periplasmic adaptor subunit, partial [Planctomycetota bacterium]